jgi:hypothetical protein
MNEIKEIIRSIKIRKNSKNLKKGGYVYAPYIIAQEVSVVEGSLLPSKKISSKYYGKI